MTPPREITQGKTVFVTVRAVGRAFRFNPTPKVRELLLFALAVMVAKYGIQLHEFEFLGNHYHLVLTDVRGCLPDFMRDLGSLISRGLNALRGHRGTNIEKGYNIVVVTDEEKIIDHAVYTLANACSANLVQRTKHWLGPSSHGYRYGEVVRVRRPKTGLWAESDQASSSRGSSPRRAKSISPGRARHRKPSRFPEVAELTLVRPPVRPGVSDGELRHEILQRLDTRERELIEERKAAGKTVLGMKAALAQHWENSPRSKEDMFKTVPNVSGRSKWARLEALQHRAAFVRDYADALAAFNAGQRDVEFPHGTWLMRRRHGVRCKPPPS